MVQSLGDTHKEICINAFPLENLIHIRSITANMPSKPGRRAFLPLQFLFDALSDVHILLCRQKKGQNRLYPIHYRGTAKHLRTNKHKQFMSQST